MCLYLIASSGEVMGKELGMSSRCHDYTVMSYNPWATMMP